MSRGWYVAGAAVLAAAGIGTGWLLWSAGRAAGPPSSAPIRASIVLPPNTQLALEGFQPGPPAISPEGRRIALVLREPGDRHRIWVREMDRDEASPLAGTEDASYPFWSYDSQTIGFFAQQQLKTLSARGGPVLSLCRAVNGKGGTWNRDGVILFTGSFNGPLLRIPAGGGSAVAVTRVNRAAGETSHRFAEFLPDGTRFIYLVARDGQSGLIRIGSLDAANVEGATIGESDGRASYASGHLLYVRGGTLLASRFDPATGQLSGAPVPIAQNVSLRPEAWRFTPPRKRVPSSTRPVPLAANGTS